MDPGVPKRSASCAVTRTNSHKSFPCVAVRASLLTFCHHDYQVRAKGLTLRLRLRVEQVPLCAVPIVACSASHRSGYSLLWECERNVAFVIACITWVHFAARRLSEETRVAGLHMASWWSRYISLLVQDQGGRFAARGQGSKRIRNA